MLKYRDDAIEAADKFESVLKFCFKVRCLTDVETTDADVGVLDVIADAGFFKACFFKSETDEDGFFISVKLNQCDMWA